MISAEDPTTIDIYWEGDDATVIYTIVSGEDASMWFRSSGDHIIGELHVIDYNDDPGGFDTFETTVSAYFSGGGEIKFESVVLDTLARSYTKIETDASGYLGWKTIINSTHLLNFNSDNSETDYEIQADGIFEVMHEIYNPEGEGITVKGEGSGSIFIDLDKEWVNGTAFESGILPISNAVGYGSGLFKVEVDADNYLNGTWVFELPGVPPDDSVIGDLSFLMLEGGSMTLELDYDYAFIMIDFGSEGE